MAQYDKRIQAEEQLAVIYDQWSGIVKAQERAALHAMLRSLLLILLALIGIVLAEGFIERFYMSMGPDRRRLGTMRLVLRFISQMIGVLVILLVVFGLPSQLSTVLALGAAGLTVALKDFIVAFFGWFVLMGRNGIRVGDWVEINGSRRRSGRSRTAAAPSCSKPATGTTLDIPPAAAFPSSTASPSKATSSTSPPPASGCGMNWMC